jgi:crossover junction endodeoxyribonuclease RusA
MTMITITLPWPDPRLSPNARSHWAVVANCKANQRAEAKALTLEALGGETFDPRPYEIKVELIFLRPQNRKYDKDNLQARMKAALDGIADALQVNDNRFDPRTRIGEVVKGGQVVVRIGEQP